MFKAAKDIAASHGRTPATANEMRATGQQSLKVHARAASAKARIVCAG